MMDSTSVEKLSAPKKYKDNKIINNHADPLKANLDKSTTLNLHQVIYKNHARTTS